jgi:hypothetical protein
LNDKGKEMNDLQILAKHFNSYFIKIVESVAKVTKHDNNQVNNGIME